MILLHLLLLLAELAPQLVDLQENLQEAVAVHRPIHYPRCGFLSLLGSERAADHPQLRYREHEVRDCVYAVLFDGIAVTLPDGVLILQAKGRKCNQSRRCNAAHEPAQ